MNVELLGHQYLCTDNSYLKCVQNGVLYNASPHVSAAFGGDLGMPCKDVFILSVNTAYILFTTRARRIHGTSVLISVIYVVPILLVK